LKGPELFLKCNISCPVAASAKKVSFVIMHPLPNQRTQRSSRSSNPSNTPPRTLAQNLHLTLLLQTLNRLRKLLSLDRHRTALAKRPNNIAIPRTPIATPEHFIKNTQQPSLEILPALALTSTSALRQQAHVDQTRARVGGGLFERGLDEADGFVDVVFGNGGRKAHFGVRFRQADHALQLTRCGGDAALRGADVLAQLAHGDVGGHEGFAGGGGDGGLNVVAGVGDVGGEEFNRLEGVSG
jgi:hypothetical protein